MGPFEMVVGIVLIVTVGGIIRNKMGVQKDQFGNERLIPRTNDVETRALKDEVKALKERIVVLERVITENHSSVSLDREIEKLRDQ